MMMHMMIHMMMALMMHMIMHAYDDAYEDAYEDAYDDANDDVYDDAYLYIIGAVCLCVCHEKAPLSVFKRFCRFSCLQLHSVLKEIGRFDVS